MFVVACIQPADWTVYTGISEPTASQVYPGAHICKFKQIHYKFNILNLPAEVVFDTMMK